MTVLSDLKEVDQVIYIEDCSLFTNKKELYIYFYMPLFGYTWHMKYNKTVINSNVLSWFVQCNWSLVDDIHSQFNWITFWLRVMYNGSWNTYDMLETTSVAIIAKYNMKRQQGARVLPLGRIIHSFISYTKLIM